MEIEDPGVCNGAALRKAQHRISQLYDSILAPCGLRSSQRSLLMNVDRGVSPTMSELAQAMVLDLSALVRAIKPLERDGYLVQEPDARDGRVRRVSLTELGVNKLAEADKLWRVAQGSFESAYGKQRAAELRLALTDVLSDEFVTRFGIAAAVRKARLGSSGQR